MAAKAASKSSRPARRSAPRPTSRPKPARPKPTQNKKPTNVGKDKGIKRGAASKLSKEEKPKNLPNLGWASEGANLQTASNNNNGKEEGPKLPSEAIPGPPKRPQIGEHDRNRASQILAPYEAKHAEWKEKHGESYDAIQQELKKLPPRPQAPQYDRYNRRQSDAEQAQHRQELKAWEAQHGERYKHLNSLIQ